MTPKYAYVLTSRAWECVALYGKRTLQMCFSILRWEDYFFIFIFSRKQHFIMPAQTQWSHVQRLSPEYNEVSPYIPLQAGYRSKKQSSAHKWLHVTSLAISFPRGYVTFFMFQFFKFYLSAMPSLPPASLSEHSLSVSFLVLLPAASFLPLRLGSPRVKEHHLELGVCISIASLHVWLFSFL
jgi:hypothetical protein